MGRNRKDESSLELLLDTICNTFGGILFLAILVSVLLTQTRRKTVASVEKEGPVAALSVADTIRLTAKTDRLAKEIQQFEQLLGDMRSLVASFTKDGLEEAISELHAAESRVAELEVNKAASLAEIADMQASTVRATLALKSNAEFSQVAHHKNDAAQDRLTKATQEQARLSNANFSIRERLKSASMIETTGKSPRERDTAKREFGLLLKYGRLYPMHQYKNLERLVNGDDFVIAHGSLFNTANPKPHAGIDLNGESMASKVSHYLGAFPPSEWYPCLVVHADSFEEFLSLKAELVQHGYEYRIAPTIDGVFDEGGEGGRVQ